MPGIDGKGAGLVRTLSASVTNVSLDDVSLAVTNASFSDSSAPRSLS